jgi:unsaturated chondroitin disaccharide hydrolase
MNTKHILPILLLNAVTLSACAQNIAPKTFKFAERQTKLLLTESEKTKKELNKPNLLSPRTLDTKGGLVDRIAKGLVQRLFCR